ncbi:hypothetical protein ACE1BS_23225 [Aeromonas jandaei]
MCDPLSIPHILLTHLDHNRLINHHFAASNFARIPKSAQSFIGLGLLLGTTRTITPAADMKAMTRPLPRFRTFGLLASMSIPLPMPSINVGAPKNATNGAENLVKMRKSLGTRRYAFREFMRVMDWWIGVL